MRLSILVAAFAVLSATLACTSARADSIVYDSSYSSAGVYVYDLNVTTENFSLSSGDTITFSGLAGVTGASTTYSGNFSTSYTPTSVTFTYTSSYGNTFYLGTDYLDVFTIDSTAASGAIAYASNGPTPLLSGSVEGPAPTPEPSSIALLATGLLGITGVMRKRLA